VPYIYPDVDSLLKQPLVGSGTCVDLIKAYVPGLKGKTTLAWKAGVNVLEAFMAGKPIRRGTAIATFENGRYPQRCETGYRGSCHHAGLLLNVMPSGIWIVDQYNNDKNRLFIASRILYRPAPRTEKLPDGRYRNAGNNALAFHVIEL
jgi:hypothetical protein